MLRNNMRYNKSQVLEKIRNIKNILIKNRIKYECFSVDEIEGYIEKMGVDEKVFCMIKMICDIKAMGDIYIPDLKTDVWWGMLMELVEITGLVCYGKIINDLTKIVSNQIIKENMRGNQISVTYITSKNLMEIFEEYKCLERFNNNIYWSIKGGEIIFKNSELRFIVRDMGDGVFINSIGY